MSVELTEQVFMLHQLAARTMALSLSSPQVGTGYCSGELALLCDLHHCDKGSLSCLIEHGYPWAPHTYSFIYEALFEARRKLCRRVFECGIGTVKDPGRKNIPSGASLRVWRDYFPQAEIYGADIDPDCLFEEDRIHTGLMDQTRAESVTRCLANFGGEPFDLMIDDGLHTASANLALAATALPHLAPEGVYVIEDIPLTELPALRAGLTVYEERYSVRYALLPASFSGDNNLIIITWSNKT